MPVIEVDRLSKTFRSRVKPRGFVAGIRAVAKPETRIVDAVRAVSFSVEEAEAVAFLGPNGAGKSTTIKMLTGILSPSSGSARVLGLDPSKRGGRERNALARSIGAVFGQKSQLWFHLPPADSFRLLGAVYEIDRKALAARSGELVERFGMAELMDVPVRRLSLGQRIRCEIAASLLHSPRVLFLDEPTIGLDVVVKREIRLLLEELVKRDRVTIFLTSHDIGDIEKICKRAIIIHHGEVVVDESMKDLKHRALAKKYVGVKYAHPVDIDLPGLSPVKRTEDAARFEVDTRRHRLPELIAALAARGELLDLTVEDEPLENIIAEIFGSRSAAEASAVTAAARDARVEEEDAPVAGTDADGRGEP
ncbi:MAG: ATP-binding cassette domain-containing protein [Spirochaetes bacterium]|nr:ATP-binding cassette domain-containing protein [Spirochaetota bacterium]